MLLVEALSRVQPPQLCGPCGPPDTFCAGRVATLCSFNPTQPSEQQMLSTLWTGLSKGRVMDTLGPLPALKRQEEPTLRKGWLKRFRGPAMLFVGQNDK